MSRLDIAQKGIPQDGRSMVLIAGRKIDIRVSTVPTIQGEKIVMRLLYQNENMMQLSQLGLAKYISKPYSRMVGTHGGIILVTGPTGSGKTTTLYASLAEIDNEARNIITIEDPVEYKISGYSQIEVKPKIGLTFAKALRSVLRQDPDVIMVGEMRDTETAQIAIQSALTGHLVFSTVHTNNAPATITRLIDMGIEPFLVSSTIIGVLANLGSLRSVEVEGTLRLALEIDQFGHAHLHAKGQFVLSDAGGDGRIVVAARLFGVHFTESIQHATTLDTGDTSRIIEIEYGIALAPKLNSLEASRQETGSPKAVVQRLSTRTGSQSHEGRQVGIYATQPIACPRTHAGTTGDN